MNTNSRRLIHLALLALFLHPAVAARAEQAAPSTRPSTTVPDGSHARQFAQWYQQCEQRVAAMKGKRCDIIFIGDSITQNWIEKPNAGWNLVGRAVWDKYYAHRNALDFGVGADGAENVLWRMDHMDIRNFSPKVAVILIGINDSGHSPEDIAAGAKAVVEKTQSTFKDVKIILVGILPNSRITQKTIEANKIIQTFGDDQSVFYLDLAPRMPRQGNGWKGVGGDGIHLSREGYEIWASAMEPLLVKLLAAEKP